MPASSTRRLDPQLNDAGDAPGVFGITEHFQCHKKIWSNDPVLFLTQ
jgi:hypothetical protein